MPILDEDGKPLLQPRPNPLMADQDIEGDWEIINPIFPGETVEYKGGQVSLPRDQEPINVPTTTSVVSDPPRVAKEQPRVTAKTNQSTKRCKCLPATAGGRDDLYDEEGTRYSMPIEVEVVVVDQGDILWRAWTNVELRPESIIYVPDDKRWWHVVQSQPWKGGILLDCIPSDRKPDFQR